MGREIGDGSTQEFFVHLGQLAGDQGLPARDALGEVAQGVGGAVRGLEEHHVLGRGGDEGQRFTALTAAAASLIAAGGTSLLGLGTKGLGIEILKSFPETVSEAFDQFIQQHSNLSSRQLEFLNLLKGFIIEREKVEKKDLINAPFTVIHPQGIRGVFNPAEINEILQLTELSAA